MNSKGRGPKIPARTRRFIHEMAIMYPNIEREDMANSLRGFFKDKNWMTPTVETTKKMISSARNSVTSEDDPWCLGISAQSGIPYEASKDLLAIGKRCLLIGRTFTIREAKWASLLRGMVEFGDLLLFASFYAVRERLWEMESTKNVDARLDTSDIDAEVSYYKMNRAYEAALRTGLLAKRYDWSESAAAQQELMNLEPGYGQSLLRFAMTETPGAVAQIFVLYGQNFAKGKMGATTATTINRNSKGTTEIEGVPMLKQAAALSEMESEVYALWLLKLSKGCHWNSLDSNHQIRLANRLFDEVVDDQEKLKAPYSQGQDTPWEPSADLLRDAGLIESAAN